MTLALAEAEVIALVVSEEALVEAERYLQEKLPRAIPEYRRFLVSCPLEKMATSPVGDVAAGARSRGKD